MLTTNSLAALFARRSLGSSQDLLGRSSERLAGGLRINRARDDAAGFGISQELLKQSQSLSVASRNANDAISMVSTAEEGLQKLSVILLRLKELSSQGANDSLGKSQRAAISGEMAELRDEVNAITERTTFNSLRLLRGDFSQAVKDEFVRAVELDGTNNSVLDSSTVKLGVESPANSDATKSRFSVADIQVDAATEGAYTLTNNGAVLTLSATINGEVKSEQVTLISGTPTGANQASISSIDGGATLLNFSKLGISITVKNERVGGSDRSPSEVATKIAALGVTSNSAYKDAGWKTVAGADWASQTDYSGLTGSDPLKAIITSSDGNIRLSTTTGLAAVRDYNGAASDGSAVPLASWTNGTATQIAFRGTAAELDAALATLQINSTTGSDQITIDIVPSDVSVYTTAAGVTSYYKVVSGGSYSWTEARAAAKSSTFSGLTGYLANVTSSAEQSFISSKLSADGWIGASDSDLLGIAGATEGTWRWVDGPEAGQIFWVAGAGNVSGAAGSGYVISPFSNWNSGEPNDADSRFAPVGEDYAYAISGNYWNDYNNLNRNSAYVIEYGGQEGVSANTSKTILIGTPGYINVGDAVAITSIQTTGVGTGNADTGIYRMSADTGAKTVTLKRFDVDGETLLGSETLSVPDGLGSGRNTKLKFEDLGVAVTLSNAADRSITLGDLESGLEKDLTIASSRMATSVSDGGPTFQIGSASKNEFSIGSFKDMRLGKNADGQHGELFNQVDSLISGLDAASDPSIADFQELQNRVEDVIEVVSSQRSDFGAIQNRLESAIRNIGEQFVNLNAARSQIQDVDYASETARLTKMQIGQQAATAMMAQANQIPNVILALIA